MKFFKKEPEKTILFACVENAEKVREIRVEIQQRVKELVANLQTKQEINI